jgi:hypothetical protein
MSITFVGLYRIEGPTEADLESRRQGGIPEAFAAKVREFPTSLPSTCKLVGSYRIMTNEIAGVMIVEAESYADLQFIDDHYAGWLQFNWHPTTTGGVPRD